MSTSNKKSMSKLLCLLLSMLMLLSVVVLPTSAADIDVCTKGHTDKNSDYICDKCGSFTGKVTGLKIASQTSSSFKITWNKTKGADGYKVFYDDGIEYDITSADYDFGFLDNDTEIADTTKTSLTITTVPAAEYKIYVCAYKYVTEYNYAALGDKSKSLSLYTSPATPTGLKKANVLATSATLFWDADINGDIKYRVYQYNSETKKWDKIRTTSDNTYTVTGLKKKTTYKFRVDAFYKVNKKTYASNKSSTLYVRTGDVQLNIKSGTMPVGDSVKLYVDGTTSKVTWSTSDKSIATVTSKGTVKALKAGKVTITAKVGSKKYTCKLTVKTVTDYLNWYFKKYDSIGEGPILAEGATISYDNGNYTFSYVSMKDGIACMMTMKPGDKKVTPTIAYMEDLDLDTFSYKKLVVANTNLTVSKYKGKSTTPTFTFTQRTGVTKSKAKTISKNALDESFTEWNKLLKSETGLTLKAFGFTSYTTK